MNRDIHKDGGDNTTYRYALNAIAKDNEQVSFLSNEYSNRLCHDYGSTIVGSTYIESKNSTLVFLENGELHLLNNDDCTSKFIASDTEFGCDWGFEKCEYVYAELKEMHPCGDLHAYWSSGCQYYWINIDEMLDPVRKQSLKETIKQERKQCSDRTCDYFKIFKCVLKPKLVPVGSDTGGALGAGAYQFVGRLFDRDKNYSNWYNISDPVYIGSENNQCGERSTGLIEVHISNLDCKYDGIELAVIQTVAGQTIVKRLADLHYNSGNTSYTYYGTEGTPIDINEILIKKNDYIQGQDLLQKDGRLWLYNIKQHRNLDYQRRANNIGVNWVEYQFTYEQAARLGIKSHMRGETYSYGIQWNYCSGKKSPVFHIPAKMSRISNLSSGTNVDNDTSSSSVYTKTQEGKYERTRKPIENTVANPQNDSYTETANKIKEWEVEMSDVCEALAACEECGKGQEACEKERQRVEEVTGKFQELLAQMGAESGLDEFPNNLSVSTIKESAAKLLQAVENRERLKVKADKYSVQNNTNYQAGEKEEMGLEYLINGSQYYDAYGFSVTGETPKILNSGELEPDYEKDIIYPDFKNCVGEYIYGELAGQQVANHKYPDNKKSKHYVSKSTGVPNPQDWDADPLADSYVNIIGPAFTNIEFPKEDELSEPLDENNPYTILYAKRTHANKKVIAKGLGIKTFTALNNNKLYHYPRHAVNSKETVDRNINQDGSRLADAYDDPSDSFIFHSLDTNTKKLALNFDEVRPQLEIYGEGWRYKLYAEGKAPDNTFYGSRVDQKGTSQFINVNKYINASGDFEPTFKIYAPPNEVISPPQGGNIPLMNKFRESSVWIGGSLPVLTKGKGRNSDNSFIGDVYEHSVPIENAAGHYIELYRDLPNQYGDLSGITYIPLLQATVGRPNGIYGPCGDIFIGPYFFHRTSFISDKVGNKFDIPMGQANLGLEVTKKEKRSVCDTPEDILLSQLGTYIHTTLPKDKDAADAKNYAGLHSSGETIRPRQEAIDAVGPETDYYYPKTLTTLLVYWGEFEVNPYLRAIGDRKNFEVVYPNIKPHQLVSALPHPWEESYLDNVLYCEVEQPSKWILTKKVLIRTILNIIFPMLGIDNLFDISSGTDFVGNLVEFPMLYAMWHLLTQQVFTNDFIDKMLGVPECKTDDQGGECACTIQGPLDNYSGFCSDFSKINDIEVGYPMPEPYNTCDCSTCLIDETDILMADFSKKEIQNINIGDEVQSYDRLTNSYVIKKVTNKWDKGRQIVYKITFRNNTHVEATLNHRWFARTRKGNKLCIITTKDLIDNPTKYYIIYANNMNTKLDSFLSLEESYLLGIFIAEGSNPHSNIRWKPKYFISQFKSEIRDKIKNKLLQTNFKWKEHKKGFYISSVNNLDYIFNDVGRGASNKRIPDIVFSLSKDRLEALYEGLMDGDGTRTKDGVDRNGFKVNCKDIYYTSSPELEYDFRLLSNLIGKPSYCSYKGKRSGFNSEKIQYTINFNHNTHLLKGKLFIKNIVEIGYKNTFDIEVAETNSFVLADSMAVSHNCNEFTNNEIYYSNKQIINSDLDAYKHFHSNQVLSITPDRGKLKKLTIINGQLMAHTTDDMLVLAYGNPTLSSDVGDIILGQSDLLREPQGMFESISEGFAGIQDSTHSINTQWGYFFVDYDAQKVYRYSQGLEEISAQGMFNFFKEHIKYCNPTDCKNEKVVGTNYFSLGVDPRINRFLITKSDDNGSYTLSYDLDHKKWISFHSYIPQLYVWDRDHMYTSNGTGIWKHDEKCNYQTYFGKYHPFIIDFEARMPGSEIDAFEFKHFVWNTEMKECHECDILNINVKKSFNRVWIRNEDQTTGYVDLINIVGEDFENKNERITDKYTPIDMVYKNNQWRINELYDYTKDCNSPIYTYNNCCIKIEEPINIDPHKALNEQMYNNRILLGNYLSIRYIADIFANKKLYLKNHKTKIQKIHE